MKNCEIQTHIGYSKEPIFSLLKNIKKYAPGIPDFTCPSIEILLRQLDTISEVIDNSSSYDDIDQIKRDLRMPDYSGALESLRDENHELRQSSKFWYQQAVWFAEAIAKMRSEAFEDKFSIASETAPDLCLQYCIKIGVEPGECDECQEHGECPVLCKGGEN